MRLENEVAIVTGAARGIRREYCIRFAEERASGVAADVIDCGETVGAVEKAGGRALARPEGRRRRREEHTGDGRGIEKFVSLLT